LIVRQSEPERTRLEASWTAQLCINKYSFLMEFHLRLGGCGVI